MLSKFEENLPELGSNPTEQKPGKFPHSPLEIDGQLRTPSRTLYYHYMRNYPKPTQSLGTSLFVVAFAEECPKGKSFFPLHGVR